ncbi:MAG TPA: phage head closure protein [Xanthobacteraceae bacterium]|nr:phage head closure protein [Xanthobacteraceae bacterium]
MSGIGEFRHRLALEVAEETADGAGGVIRSFAPLGQIWAKIEPATFDDRMLSDKRIGVLTHRITLRHRESLTLSHRFVLGTRVFVIRALRDPDETRRYIECLVEEQHP